MTVVLLNRFYILTGTTKSLTGHCGLINVLGPRNYSYTPDSTEPDIKRGVEIVIGEERNVKYEVTEFSEH